MPRFSIRHSSFVIRHSSRRPTTPPVDRRLARQHLQFPIVREEHHRDRQHRARVKVLLSLQIDTREISVPARRHLPEAGQRRRLRIRVTGKRRAERGDRRTPVIPMCRSYRPRTALLRRGRRRCSGAERCRSTHIRIIDRGTRLPRLVVRSGSIAHRRTPNPCPRTCSHRRPMTRRTPPASRRTDHLILLIRPPGKHQPNKGEERQPQPERIPTITDHRANAPLIPRSLRPNRRRPPQTNKRHHHCPHHHPPHPW
jgi:hypothetical protein